MITARYYKVHPDLIGAANTALAAFNEATSNRGGFVAVALAIIANNAAVERVGCHSDRVSSVIESQTDKAFEQLRISGYLASGHCNTKAYYC